MDDLISRKAAIVEIDEYLHELDSCISEPDLKLDGYKNGLQVAIQELKALPAVDAAPVVHGRWLGRRYDFKEYKYVIVPYDATTFNNPDDLFCSVCNTPALSNGAENDVPSNYCPNCGARMDGERRESE